MTPKERAAMQQALMYLDAIINGDDVKPYKLEGTALALREALAEPVSKCAECLTDNGHQFHCSKAAKFQLNQLAEQAEQEPDVVGAYEVWDKDEQVFTLVYPQAIHKYNLIPEESITRTFYASPVRTKDLTDDEIQKWIDVLMYDPPEWALKRFARAVIAADREKNK